MSVPTRIRALLLAVPLLFAAACDDAGPTEIDPAPEAAAFMAEESALAAASVADLVTRPIGGSDLVFWPYTGRTPTLGDAADPINLVLTGEADPRAIRERLMSLSGDRGPYGLPPVPPFDCTWSDAIGGTQSVYTEPHGWTGSVVQLQCGDYQPIRIHLRLFRVGDVTLANAHFDLIIPGTTDHEVISWELPRTLAALDLMRIGGSLAGAAPAITQSPTWRTVNPAVFFPLQAAEPGLFGLLTSPPPGLPASTTATGDLLNDGNAWIFDMASIPSNGSGGAVISRQTVNIDFDQVIPRPFCEGGGQEYLKVVGPVTLDQQVMSNPSGAFTTRWHAKGHLDVIQVAPVGPGGSWVPVSEPYRALVNQQGRGVMTDHIDMVNDVQLRMEIRSGAAGDRGQLRLNMRIGPNGAGDVSGSASCKG